MKGIFRMNADTSNPVNPGNPGYLRSIVVFLSPQFLLNLPQQFTDFG